MSTAGEITNHDVFAALAAPFDDREVRSRNQGGRELSYITARTVMNRLDEVMGPENWWDDYQPIENASICRLTLRLPDGRQITKVDVGGNSNTNDPSDCEKSGMSDAFKRAAVKFGVGRYLYGDGVPRTLRGGPAAVVRPARDPGGDDGPARQQPRQAPAQPRRDNGHSNGNGGGNGRNGGGYGDKPPASGKALFAWAMKQKDATGEDVVAVINGYGSGQRWPKRMVDWGQDQVEEAHSHALAFLAGNVAGPAPAPARQTAPPRPAIQAAVEAEDFSQVGPDDPNFIPF